jgi:hypothetical protein
MRRIETIISAPSVTPESALDEWCNAADAARIRAERLLNERRALMAPKPAPRRAFGKRNA